MVNISQVYVIGVSHIKANTNKVLDALKSIPMNKETLAYIEPKKNVLIGAERCVKKSIEFFFIEILRFLMSKRIKIAALNPKEMPSHKAKYLFEKYSKQFAEEEYMAGVIKNSENKGNIVVIIGDLHAERICSILEKDGLKTKYVKLNKETPDDVFAKSWRDALENKRDTFISSKWLRKINSEIKSIMNLPENVNAQEACWDDERLYEKYLFFAKKLMRKYEPCMFTEKLSSDIEKESLAFFDKGRSLLKISEDLDDHFVFSYPYPIMISD